MVPETQITETTKAPQRMRGLKMNLDVPWERSLEKLLREGTLKKARVHPFSTVLLKHSESRDYALETVCSGTSFAEDDEPHPDENDSSVAAKIHRHRTLLYHSASLFRAGPLMTESSSASSIVSLDEEARQESAAQFDWNAALREAAPLDTDGSTSSREE